MRYRKLDANGDYTLGNQAAFYVNQPEAVAQAVLTRLKLWTGEWFLNTTDGTPWMQEILGKRRVSVNPDAAIKQRILGTQGVKEITDYASSFDGNSRTLSVSCSLNTIYGTTTLSVTL